MSEENVAACKELLTIMGFEFESLPNRGLQVLFPHHEHATMSTSGLIVWPESVHKTMDRVMSRSLILEYYSARMEVLCIAPTSGYTARTCVNILERLGYKVTIRDGGVFVELDPKKSYKVWKHPVTPIVVENTPAAVKTETIVSAKREEVKLEPPANTSTVDSVECITSSLRNLNVGTHHTHYPIDQASGFECVRVLKHMGYTVMYSPPSKSVYTKVEAGKTYATLVDGVITWPKGDTGGAPTPTDDVEGYTLYWPLHLRSFGKGAVRILDTILNPDLGYSGGKYGHDYIIHNMSKCENMKGDDAATCKELLSIMGFKIRGCGGTSFMVQFSKGDDEDDEEYALISDKDGGIIWPDAVHDNMDRIMSTILTCKNFVGDAARAVRIDLSPGYAGRTCVTILGRLGYIVTSTSDKKYYVHLDPKEDDYGVWKYPILPTVTKGVPVSTKTEIPPPATPPKYECPELKRLAIKMANNEWGGVYNQMSANPAESGYKKYKRACNIYKGLVEDAKLSLVDPQWEQNKKAKTSN